MAKHPYMEVAVMAPEGVLFDGKAIALSAINETGKFDILPEHANFISMIKEKLMLRPDKKHVQEIKLDQGVLMCRNNKVNVFIGLVK
jgi:F0F1-type ATP synthase epsilon subunit